MLLFLTSFVASFKFIRGLGVDYGLVQAERKHCIIVVTNLI